VVGRFIEQQQVGRCQTISASTRRAFSPPEKRSVFS
jgi:hypothetical protein